MNQTLTRLSRQLRLAAAAALLLATAAPAAWAQTAPATQPQGLAVGSTAPDVRLAPYQRDAVQLSDLWQKGPVVLVFYRGQWCPYCNLYLRNLADSLAQLQAQGVQVVAVSPELPEHVAQTMQKTGATYAVVPDADGRLMRAFGVDFAVDTATVAAYRKRGLDLAQANGAKADNNVRLPVPATYLIGRDGRIRYRHFDPDYRKRPSIAELLAAVPG